MRPKARDVVQVWHVRRTGREGLLASVDDGTARGVDIFTVWDGKIAEKLTYVTMSRRLRAASCPRGEPQESSRIFPSSRWNRGCVRTGSSRGSTFM
jgi:hypothetical protein